MFYSKRPTCSTFSHRLLSILTYASDRDVNIFSARLILRLGDNNDDSISQTVIVKLEFHGTDTDTDTDTDILACLRARIVARMSACLATSPFSLPRAGHARRFSPTCPPTCLTRALLLATILARMSVRDARAYTCKRVLYTISYRVHVYKITR